MTRDKEMVTLTGFPAGVNNTAPDTRPPVNQDGAVLAARSAVNLDFDDAGRARLRRGFTTVAEGEAHSLFAGSYLLAVVDGDLKAFDDPGDGLAEHSTVIAGIGKRFVSYASDDDSTWWSNGVASGRIDANLGTHPFWVDTPDPPALAVSANGGLAAGQYEVSLTVLDADGRESGASNPEVATLTAGQGIDVTFPAAPTDAARWRVYRSTPDGEVLYLAADLPIAATGTLLGAATLGKALDTAWLFPLPPCNTIRYGHGRILGLQADALVWSEPYRLGLMHDENYLGMSAPALLEPVGEGGDGAGWYVSDAKRTYFMAGADPKQWRQRIVAPHPVVPGTGLTVPGNVFGLETTAPVAFWLGANGTFYLGLPGGIVQPVRDRELALPVNSERGAAGFFTHDGIRQIVTSFIAGEPNAAAMGDSAEATVRRHGVTLT